MNALAVIYSRISTNFLGTCRGLGDFSPEEVLGLTYKVQDYQGANLAELARKGLSADYVERETRRAVTGVSSHSAESAPAAKTPGTPKIWPGIDIDIPTGQDEKKTEPQEVCDAVRAALGAGADGVILSRKYSEMRLDNLRAAGQAFRG